MREKPRQLCAKSARLATGKVQLAMQETPENGTWYAWGTVRKKGGQLSAKSFISPVLLDAVRVGRNASFADLGRACSRRVKRAFATLETRGSAPGQACVCWRELRAVGVGKCLQVLIYGRVKDPYSNTKRLYK